MNVLLDTDENGNDTKISTVPQLRPYQLEAARAILDSVFNRRGLTFSIEIARQGGKNELSVQLEVLLLGLRIKRPENII